MNKVSTIEEVVSKVHDGATIMIGGFLGVGAPLKCIDALVKKGVKDLTVITNVCSYPGGNFGMSALFANKQVKKFISSHVGTCPEAMALYKAGELEVEFFPMGTWIEKVRAGGAGLGGVLTPIGLGTLMEEGKQKLNIQGKDYLLELPLKADFAFIKGWKGDKMGNVEYRQVAIGSNPTIASAAAYTVAEVNEIVEIGGIDPSRVGTPGVFVKAVVQGNTMEEHQKIYADLWVRSGLLKA